ncbi:Fur family transcriptional regulator [Arthrobacter rhombi]|uniref:Transcriptional regulator, FUR family n=1 Tax=Arthrobacter rhombi TaxID=71253 RepID=A0A1R4GF21_9MICC|nr:MULTISPECIES: Fur family transcriptional regulator [Micrococcaceae]PCC25948.1 transcriptional repressor [Glutamicibacter sp. BW78]SJM66739.1 Transcriptional regulator, FUR family [Arthrobacter rhombi]
MDHTEQLHELGLRVTRQRLAVLRFLETNPHSSADTVASGVREELPEVSMQSVYNVLNDLTALGMLRRFTPPGSAALHETRVDDNHHHAVCMACGRIEDVECAVGHAPCLSPSDTHGMNIQIADVVYQGVCASCRESAQATEVAGSGAPVPENVA